MPKYCRLALFVLASFFSYQHHAFSNLEDREKPVALFASEEPLQLTLIVDVKQLRKDDSDNPQYQEGKLILYHDSVEKEFSIKVKARGISRRKQDFCTFPPLKLNFKKKQVKGTVFERQDKLKLVDYCKDSDVNEIYVLKEYLVYKLYNQLTPYSFKVRLAMITYKDLNEKARDVKRFGFLIEDNDVMAKRNEGKITDIEMSNQDRCERSSLDLLTLFQFMIGNLDWSVAKQHNAKLIMEESGVLIPVPYDFDFCGFVNARYANPPEQFDITDVKERVFRGRCRIPGTYEAVIEIFNETKSAIYNEIHQFQPLDEKHKKQAIKYLDQFYSIVNDPKAMKREIYDACPSNHQHLHTKK